MKTLKCFWLICQISIALYVVAFALSLGLIGDFTMAFHHVNNAVMSHLPLIRTIFVAAVIFARFITFCNENEPDDMSW